MTTAPGSAPALDKLAGTAINGSVGGTVPPNTKVAVDVNASTPTPSSPTARPVAPGGPLANPAAPSSAPPASTTTRPPASSSAQPTTTPVPASACPGADAPGAANVANLRCLIDKARAGANPKLDPLKASDMANYYAGQLAINNRINPANVCSGKPATSWRNGEVPARTAQQAFDAMGGLKNQLISSATATDLGIAYNNNQFVLFQATCAK